MALTVVTGPPAGGKSSWVLARAQPGDVVIDLDRIAQALTAPGADLHRYSRQLRTVAQRARQAAVTEALKVCKALDVYVIHTQPGADQLAHYAQYGAQVVEVDPGRQVVLARCAEQRSSTVIAAVERWYSTRDLTSDDQHAQSHSGSRSW